MAVFKVFVMKENLLGNEKTLLVNEVLADNSPEGQHEKKLSRYASAKQRQELVSDYILQDIKETGNQKFQKEAVALCECGQALIFRDYFTLGIKKLVAGVTCKKHLLCALCAIRRAAKCIALYSDKINLVEADQDLEEVMITFTIKHKSEDSLQDSFDFLLGCMKKLLQLRRNALKKNAETYTEMKNVLGAVYAYEVTFSKENGFHPHCHMIALVPKGAYEYRRMTIKGKSVLVPQILKDGIIEDWKKITNGSYIVDVRKIEKKEFPEQGEDIQGSRLEALVEVFKYALKMNRLGDDISSPSAQEDSVRLQLEAYEVLKGRRMIGSFGSLWGVKIPDNMNDEPLEDKEVPYIDLVYQYAFGSYQLVTHGKVDTEVVSAKRLNDDRYFKLVLKNSGFEEKKDIK